MEPLLEPNFQLLFFIMMSIVLMEPLCDAGLEKPVILVKGSKTRVRTGEKVEWWCPVKGMPPPTLTWYMVSISSPTTVLLCSISPAHSYLVPG